MSKIVIKNPIERMVLGRVRCIEINAGRDSGENVGELSDACVGSYTAWEGWGWCGFLSSWWMVNA